jgi:1,4-dihydroxy-2-naphthoate octaprenyltransferase
MASTKAWIQASRLTSQSYIFLPLLLGQALAYHQGFAWHWGLFAITHLFGLAIQLYIVYANDYADIETDKSNKTFNMFSGGSRVLVEGLIQPGNLGKGAVLMALLSVLSGVVATIFFDRIWLITLAMAGLLLLWMYSYKPVRLSYRGGGETLQMLGVGLVLPLFGYYAQSGTFAEFPWLIMALMLPTNLASGMATSLPDEPSDRLSAKKTSSVIFGVVNNTRVILSLNTVATVLLIIWSVLTKTVPFSFAYILPVIVLLGAYPLWKNRPGSEGLNRFVGLSVGYTLALTSVLIIAFF